MVTWFTLPLASTLGLLCLNISTLTNYYSPKNIKVSAASGFHYCHLIPFVWSHVALTADGNVGVPVVVNGLYYGRASGMAPRARIAVYNAIYPSIGTLSDVLAAIDQPMSGVLSLLV